VTLLSTAGDMFSIGSNEVPLCFNPTPKKEYVKMVIGSITTVIQVINMLTPYGLILYFIF
jgi:hypothetical protein